MKNRGMTDGGGLKVEMNHLGGNVSGGSGDKAGRAAIETGDFPDSSIGEGMDITIQGANGHVKHNSAEDNQSLKSYDSKTGGRSVGGLNNEEKLNKYSDMSIGLGMDISIRGDGDAVNKEAATAPLDENGWSRHSSLQFDEKGALDNLDDLKAAGNGENGGPPLPPDEDILSQTEIKHVEEVLMDPVDDVLVEDCCPEVCYRVCPCCIGDPDSPFWQLWYRHRLQVSR